MRWHPFVVLSHAKERSTINFFTAIVFLGVFGVIFLSNLLLQTSLVTASEVLQVHLRQERIETPTPVRVQKAIDAVWQPVAGTRSKFFVYSAYVESRTMDAVRVIAAARTRGADAVVCRLWLPDNRTITVKARVAPINENWGLKYSASYVLCSLRNTGVRAQETAGAAVAVLAEAAAHRAPANLLPVLDTLPKPGIQDTLHVCVKPFYNGNASEDWLVEWFELNRQLGVSHFYMYNESLSAPAACVLERYRREGLVTLLRWNLPFISRTGGQYAAFGDCLYRSMSSAGWLLITDVDEVVFPQREQALPALLSALTVYLPPSAFLFRNAYFYLRWEDWKGRTGTGAEGVKLLPPLSLDPLDAVWQPVAGTRLKFFVYSAYVDGRTTDVVRVIAATKTRGADAVVCRLWLLDNRIITVKATITTISENRRLKYSASYVLCSLRNTGVRAQETAGAAVAVLAEAAAHRAPANLLPVLDTLPKPGIQENLHVCVKPFYLSYARDDWLVEWFELNRLLGVSHFYMYNGSVSAQVACVLERYRRDGLVTLLQWELPLVSDVEIKMGGELAAINDCLYRSMSSAGWLLVIDVDEVVLPRRERTLPALLMALRASYNPPSRAPSAFLFRNAFFYLRWEDDAEAPAPLLTARKTLRWAAPHAIMNRSKYALRPSDAVELGNHFIWELVPGASVAGVPTDRALLHHYRIHMDCESGSCHTTIDRTAHRWAKELMQSVTAEKKPLARICPA